MSSEESDKLTVIVRHNKKEYNISAPLDQTVGDFKEEVHKQTKIPPSVQKYVFQGKVPKDANAKIRNNGELIKNLNLKNGTKVMLVGAPIDKLLNLKSSDTSSDSSQSKKKEEESPVPLKLSQLKEHSKVVEKGVPPGAEPGDKTIDLPLPKSIKNIYDRSGQIVRLTFKVTEQELWIASKDRTEKIPFFQVRDIESEPIHSNDSYHIMALQIGSTPNSKLWFYYIPAQYHKAIKYTVLGIHNFPFLAKR